MTLLLPRAPRLAALGLFAAAWLAGCETLQPPPAAPATISIARLYEQPAERAFINGLRLYEDGQYDRADAALKQALAGGLKDGADRAIAYKHIAFVACAYNRPTECEDAFRHAFAADPGFRLSDAEVGHPLWGPVYKRVAGTVRRG